jgi:hypothetical protein
MTRSWKKILKRQKILAINNEFFSNNNNNIDSEYDKQVNTSRRSDYAIKLSNRFAIFDSKQVSFCDRITYIGNLSGDEEKRVKQKLIEKTKTMVHKKEGRACTNSCLTGDDVDSAERCQNRAVSQRSEIGLAVKPTIKLIDAITGVATESRHASTNVNDVMQHTTSDAEPIYTTNNSSNTDAIDLQVKLDDRVDSEDAIKVETECQTKISTDCLLQQKCISATELREWTKENSNEIRPTENQIECNKLILQELPIGPLAANRMFVEIEIVDSLRPVEFQIDSGSDITLIPLNTVSQLLPNKMQEIKRSDIQAKTISSSTLEIIGSIDLLFVIKDGPDATQVAHNCLVTAQILNPILGQDFLCRASALIKYEQKEVELFGTRFCTVNRHDSVSSNYRAAPLYLTMAHLLPPGAILHLEAQCKSRHNIATSLIQPRRDGTKEIEITTGVTEASQTNVTPVLVKNTSCQNVHLPQDFHIADLVRLRATVQVHECTISANDPRDNKVVNGSANVKSEIAPTAADLDKLIAQLHINRDDFDDAQWKDVRAMLTTYFNVFDQQGEIGRIDMQPVEVELVPDVKFKCAVYNYNEKDKELIDQEIDKLLKQGVIRPGRGDYQTPVVLVKSKTRARICYDYRRLHGYTEARPTITLPRIADILEQLAAARFFSVFDIRSAYHHIPVSERSSKILGIRTADQCYDVMRLPFGYINSGYIFCEAMRDVLKPLDKKKHVSYLDDLCGYDSEMTGLIKTTGQTLECMQRNNIKLNASKCKLFQSEIDLLGHRINRSGVRLAIDSVEKIRDYPQPRTMKECQRFLGTMAWSAKWLNHFSDTARPLYQAVKKKPFRWNDDCERAFSHLKMMVTSEPVLQHYDGNEEHLSLITDASLTGWGCILANKKDGIFHPIKFYSKCFDLSEYKMSTYEKELKSLYLSIKAFSAFLIGRKFTCYTDNKAVCFIHTLSLKNNLSHKWAKWIQYIAQFQITIEHIPGLANPSDSLSRNKCKDAACKICARQYKFLNVPFRFTADPNNTKIIPTENFGCQTPKRWPMIASHNDGNGQVGLITGLGIPSTATTPRMNEKDTFCADKNHNAAVAAPGNNNKRVKEGCTSAITNENETESKHSATSVGGDCSVMGTILDEMSAQNNEIHAINNEQDEVCIGVVSKQIKKPIDFSNSLQVAAAQNLDIDLLLIKNRIAGSLGAPTKLEIAKFSFEARKLIVQWPKLGVTEEEVLYLKVKGQNGQVGLPVIPKENYAELCESIHIKLMHVGYNKLRGYLKDNFICYGINRFARRCTKFCANCQRAKPYTRNTQAPMRSTITTAPSQLIQTDIFGPLNPAKGHRYILTVIDHFSKYLVLIPLKNIDTGTVTKAILTNFCQYFATANRVHSDNGGCYSSELWNQIWSKLGVDTTHSSAFLPRSNATVEIPNKFIKNSLIICAQTNPGTWVDKISGIQLAHNATVSTATGFTPNRLFLGREMILNKKLIVTDAPNERSQNTDDYVTNFTENLHAAMTYARRTTAQQQKTTKIYYDRNSAAINIFVKGQLVLLRDHSPKKLDQRYSETYKVISKLIGHAYWIEKLSDGTRRKASVIHLKPFFSDEIESGTRDTAAQTENDGERQESNIGLDVEEERNDQTQKETYDIDLPVSDKADIDLPASQFVDQFDLNQHESRRALPPFLNASEFNPIENAIDLPVRNPDNMTLTPYYFEDDQF